VQIVLFVIKVEEEVAKEEEVDIEVDEEVMEEKDLEDQVVKEDSEDQDLILLHLHLNKDKSFKLFKPLAKLGENVHLNQLSKLPKLFRILSLRLLKLKLVDEI
jgi:hypothetical protein